MRWADVEPEWQACVALAWEAYARNTTPVAAVVYDGEGREVARGRNARYSRDAEWPLAGSHLAHAETVALTRLGSEARYGDHRVYTWLEPCLLCVGAAVLSFVGEVHWAGVDAFGGATALVPGGYPPLERATTTFHGPRGDVLGLFAGALHVEYYLRRNPDGAVIRTHRHRAPDLVAAAEGLAEAGAYEVACSGGYVGPFFDGAADGLIGWSDGPTAAHPS